MVMLSAVVCTSIIFLHQTLSDLIPITFFFFTDSLLEVKCLWLICL